jgi:hypothetical protein
VISPEIEANNVKVRELANAEWPEDKHKSASKETGIVICWPLTTAAIECALPRAIGISQREKKL